MNRTGDQLDGTTRPQLREAHAKLGAAHAAIESGDIPRERVVALLEEALDAAAEGR
jgi:hypothetical protein